MFARFTTITCATIILATLFPSTATADDFDRAKALLARSQQTLQAARSITANQEIITITDKQTSKRVGFVEYMKPNLLRFEEWPDAAARASSLRGKPTPHTIAVCDGSTYRRTIGDDLRTIHEQPATPNGIEFVDQSDLPWIDFFQSGLRAPNLPTTKNVRLTSEPWGGELYDVITASERQKSRWGVAVSTTSIFIGADHIVHRELYHTSMPGMNVSFDIQLRNVRLNLPVARADFSFTKPANATLVASHVDPRALTLLWQVDMTTAHTQAITATTQAYARFTDINGKPHEIGRAETQVKLLRPNYAFVETVSDAALVHAKGNRRVTAITASDGTNLWTIDDVSQKTYGKKRLETHGLAVLANGQRLVDPLADFFEPGRLNFTTNSDRTKSISVVYDGERTWKGAVYKVVECRRDTIVLCTNDTYFIGVDNRVHRLISVCVDHGTTTVTDYSIVNIDTHPVLNKADFAYRPPTDMKRNRRYLGNIFWNLDGSCDIAD